MDTTGGFDRLRLDTRKDRLVYRYPSTYYDPRKVQNCIKELPGPIECSLSEHSDDSSTLEISTTHFCQLEPLAAELFSRINGYPCFSTAECDGFSNSERPVVSCIILLTANERFVLRQLIPSIVHNTRDHAIEIIVVYNGIGANLDNFRGFRICTSDFAAVASGYNKGAQEGNGEYLALFHDDCIVHDPQWISKCIQSLAEDAIVVSPEIRHVHAGPPSETFLIAKNVPIVIRRKDYWRLGGYDEMYYAGWEDLDFTYNVLARHGAIKPVDMGYLHFNGMSTIVMLGPNPWLYKRLFENNILPQMVIRNLRKQCLQRLLSWQPIRLVSSRNLLYFAEKFDAYLTACCESTQLKEYHRAIVAKDPHNPVLHDRNSLVAFYKTIINADLLPTQS